MFMSCLFINDQIYICVYSYVYVYMLAYVIFMYMYPYVYVYVCEKGVGYQYIPFNASMN